MLKTLRHLPAMLVALGVTVGALGCAPGVYATRGGVYNQDVQRRAYDNGYRAGFDRGRDDAGHRRTSATSRYSEYREGDRGYRRNDGDRNTYRQAFRHGFEEGYRVGFDRGYPDNGRRR